MMTWTAYMAIGIFESAVKKGKIKEKLLKDGHLLKID